MPLACPAELKKIVPYIRRAEELDKDRNSPESRLVAYYCRQYAVHLGIPLASESAAAKTCLGHILENLESEKAAMDNFTREEAAYLCRKFATRVFDKADGEDRLGLASKDTARTFYASANFLQILVQFYHDGDESAERADDRKRIIYAKWKATEILKAIKEGRTPTPGGYGEEEPMEEDDEEGETGKHNNNMKENDKPEVDTIPQEAQEEEEEVTPKEREDDYAEDDEEQVPISLPPSVPVALPERKEEKGDENRFSSEEEPLSPPPAYPGLPKASENRPRVSFDAPPPPQPEPLPPQTHSKSTEAKKGGGMFALMHKKGAVSKAQIADATELTQFALAALHDKNAELAAERLHQALEALGR